MSSPSLVQFKQRKAIAQLVKPYYLGMASASSDNKDDVACDECGAPASWADKNNLSWKQSLNDHLGRYLKSPRMWPIGYIIESPYSPFRLEIDMPDHKSWRDAFEDLLALGSGGQMISLESRKKEAEYAKRIWYDGISRDVSLVNDKLKSDAKYLALLKRIHDLAARKDFAPTLGAVKLAIPAKEKSTKQTVAAAESMIAVLKQQMGQSWPASSYKMRGQWMASLVSSGALPGWRTEIFDSSEGFQVSLSKLEGDPSDHDGQKMTESELKKQYEEGIPVQLGSPIWSTDAGYYPEPEDDGVKYPDLPIRPSILSQATSAECTKSDKGNISTQVTLINEFTDGTTERKEIIDNSSKVLEEIHRAYASMQERNAAVAVAVQETQCDMLAQSLEELEEVYEEELVSN